MRERKKHYSLQIYIKNFERKEKKTDKVGFYFRRMSNALPQMLAKFYRKSVLNAIKWRQEKKHEQKN